MCAMMPALSSMMCPSPSMIRLARLADIGTTSVYNRWEKFFECWLRLYSYNPTLCEGSSGALRQRSRLPGIISQRGVFQRRNEISSSQATVAQGEIAAQSTIEWRSHGGRKRRTKIGALGSREPRAQGTDRQTETRRAPAQDQ